MLMIVKFDLNVVIASYVLLYALSLAGYSPRGHKDSYTTERVSHALLYFLCFFVTCFTCISVFKISLDILDFLFLL